MAWQDHPGIPLAWELQKQRHRSSGDWTELRQLSSRPLPETNRNCRTFNSISFVFLATFLPRDINPSFVTTDLPLRGQNLLNPVQQTSPHHQIRPNLRTQPLQRPEPATNPTEPIQSNPFASFLAAFNHKTNVGQIPHPRHHRHYLPAFSSHPSARQLPDASAGRKRADRGRGLCESAELHKGLAPRRAREFAVF